MLNRLADALKMLAKKALEVLPTIVGSVVSEMLNFVVKYIAENRWPLIVFLAWFVSIFLM